MSCPPAEQLLGFASGALTDDQAASLESHIDACSECRGVLSNLARGDEAPPSFGRYRVDTVLGSGGMGIVYRAYDPQLARAVAIKVLRRAGEDAAGRARLVREAQSLARVSHPNVCHVYDVGTDGDEVWVAMELVDGASLRQWTGERRAQQEVIDVLLAAAEGIAAAHAAGIVHRDVKPENVLVTRDGRAVVTDFGLARPQDLVDPVASTIATDPHLTATGAIAGTPAYLAPEQLTQDPIDARVDQFAWAVMAWELLTGVRPFPVVFAARLEAIRAGVTPPPTMRSGVAAALTKAMSVAPRDRFTSMRELIDAVKDGKERAAAAPSKRSARGAAIGAAVVLVAAGGAMAAMRWTGDGGRRSGGPEIRGSGGPGAGTEAHVQEKGAGPLPAALQEKGAGPLPAPALQPDGVRPRSRESDGVGQRTAPGRRTEAGHGAEAGHAALSAGGPDLRSSGPASRARSNYQRGNALAVLSEWCHVPYDFAHPDPATRNPRADWGKVTSVASEPGRIGDRDVSEDVITIAGQRGTYRVKADQNELGRVPAATGDLLAICVEDEGNAYQLAGGPLTLTHTAVTLSQPPRTAEIAKLRALHVQWGAFLPHPVTGKLALDADRRYLVRDTVGARDGRRFQMTHWIVEVPEGIPGADAMSPGKAMWLVVERPEVEDGPDGKKLAVAHAVAAIDDLFP
jgi:predicted Ser/Thr protein kinase